MHHYLAFGRLLLGQSAFRPHPDGSLLFGSLLFDTLLFGTLLFDPLLFGSLLYDSMLFGSLLFGSPIFWYHAMHCIQVYMVMLTIFCTNSINILAGVNGLEAEQV